MNKARFKFGKNWESFSHLVDEERLAAAEDRLASLLGSRDLSGRTFLDIGCGSGLHSLAALRLGARKIVGFDLAKQHSRKRSGLFGSGNDEYLFRKRAGQPANPEAD